MVAVAAAAWGIHSRHHSDAELADWTKAQSVPTVAIVKPQAEGAAGTLVLPGNVQALNSAPIYARTNG